MQPYRHFFLNKPINIKYTSIRKKRFKEIKGVVGISVTKRKDQGWDECRNPYKNTVAHWYQCSMCLYSNIYRNIHNSFTWDETGDDKVVHNIIKSLHIKA